ncbi:MAG: hypothetical protein ABIH42_04945 [Planctomycetota bacterium]
MPDIQKTKKRLGGILMAQGLVTPEQVTEALERQKRKGGVLSDILIDLSYITEESLIKFLLGQFQFPLISPNNYDINKEIFEKIPVEMMRKYSFLPLDKLSNILIVASGGLLEEEVIEELKKITECEVKIYMAFPSQIRKVLQKLAPLDAAKKEEIKTEEKPKAVPAKPKTEEEVVPLEKVAEKEKHVKVEHVLIETVSDSEELAATPMEIAFADGNVNWQGLFNEVDKSIREEVAKKKPTGPIKPPKVYQDDDY